MVQAIVRRCGKIGFLVTLAIAVVLATACGPGSRQTGDSPADPLSAADRGEGPAKQIGVAPFELRTQYTDPYSRELMQSYVLGAIRTECPGIYFVQPADREYPEVLRNLPRLESGDLDNLQAAIAGRQLGLSALMVGTLTSVGTEEKDWGIWFLKQSRHYVRVQVLIEIYDTETATKLVDEVAARQVRIDAADLAMIERKDRIDSGFVEEVLEIISQKIDDDICEAIDELSWKSYVLSVDTEALWIASGSRSGLQPGQVLEVFNSNAVMQGYGGHRYFKPGPKVAEVKVVEVQPQRSKAIVLSGGDIEPLGTVKFKD